MYVNLSSAIYCTLNEFICLLNVIYYVEGVLIYYIVVKVSEMLRKEGFAICWNNMSYTILFQHVDVPSGVLITQENLYLDLRKGLHFSL